APVVEYSYTYAWHVPANCDRCTPHTCGLSIEPQEQVSGFKEGRSVLGPSFILNDRSSASEVHAAHSAHASTGTARHRWALPLRQLGNHRLGRDEQTRDRGRALQRRSHNFGRVDDALRHQVAILAGLCVKAEGVGVLF